LGASPASRGRGLKQGGDGMRTASSIVARFARAWIETASKPNCGMIYEVARFARAWIETPTHWNTL